ncbi:hypothetical protein PHISCL_01894 [Aspergillus sclerotialis]|uniref:Uncharacterized protein n=1 Tax=Aspergillus sclerotialis TaxID=2070753 RepID=A0A3A3A8U2_9EURO|nr:hypothetical protein PHISCL_01894 [Aspergillus sclerotialis]
MGMALPTSFQLSIELTKILPIREAISAVTRPILQQARELKRSGSDFIVEEDLAAVFGRGRIDTKLERHFKSTISPAKVEIMYPASDIVLHSGSGPTVHRALKEPRYLSTVIQLSFLGFMHERTTFSSNLVACLNERYRLGAPDSSPDTNYEDIVGLLRVCASQTGEFPWELYIGLVEVLIPKTCASMINDATVDGLQWRVLTSNLLLAAIDYLYLVQAFPEDRVMAVPNQAGLIPLVIWAHYVLGLTVLLKSSPDGDILFGSSSHAQVIIKWCDHMDLAEPINLLDSNMDIVLSTELMQNIHARIISEERCRLKGYGTKLIYRWNNTDSRTALSRVQLVQLVLAFCRVVSPMLYRVCLRGKGLSKPLTQYRDNAAPWRLTEAAEVFFDGIMWSEEEIDKHTDYLKTRTLESLFETILDPMQRGTDCALALKLNKGYIHGQVQFVKMVAIMLLACSKIVNIQSCSDMPLTFCHHGLYSFVRDGIYEKISNWDGRQYLPINEADWFNIIARLLLNNEFKAEPRSNRKRMSLVSAWGWSIYLSNFNDSDPEEIDCQLLYARRGVPTNRVTNEQKFRILDQLWMGGHTPPDPVVVDHGDSYTPRCAASITGRKVFYSSMEREFWQTTQFHIRLEGTCATMEQDPKMETTIFLHTSYRKLHRALWTCTLTEPCSHQSQRPSVVTLHDGMVTVKGFRWNHFPNDDICICLVKGNSWARWLVLAGIIDDYEEPTRNILLRTDNCCEACASDLARNYGGQWLVIL